MMTITFEEQTKQIAKEYCRNIVVIDDKIFKRKNKDDDNDKPYTDEYYAFYESCNEQGIACHLFQYTDTENSKENAMKLAARTDVVILDWLLSNVSKQEVTISIIKEIINHENNNQAIRFILIYTDQTISRVQEEIQKKFSDLQPLLPKAASNTPPLSIESEREDEEPEVVTGKDDEQQSDANDPIYMSNGKLFIGIHEKSDKTPVLDGKKLIELIHSLLYNSYTDYLHWAGLELSTRIRDLMPQILASLPTGTNGPILYQHLFLEGDNEISEQISEMILDELRMMFIHKPLQISCGSVLQNYLESFFPKELIGSKAKTKKNLKKQTEKLTEAFLCKETPDSKDEKKLAMTMHIGKLNSNITGFIAIDNHIKWANLKESLLFNDYAETNKKVWPGYIYANKNSKNPQSYLLCITPACDCYRPGEKKLFFLIGSKSKEKISRMSHTKTVTNNQTINWDPTRVQSLTFKQVSQKYKIVGALRKDFVNRIVQRVWNYQTRVGVDSSELLRRIRKE